MAGTSGHLFSKEEIEKACALIENLFGTNYFRQGTELLKDSDPSWSGMGRRHSAGPVSKLIRAWYRSMEELAYADLSGFFKPGIHSAVIGILGKSLERLQGTPGVGEAARGLLDDSTFGRTLLALSVAAGFRHSYKNLHFPAEPENYFFIGDQFMVVCLQPDIKLTEVPLRLSGSDLTGLIRFSVLAPVFKLQQCPARLKRIFYVDISELPLPLAGLGDILAEASAEFFDTPGLETAAIVLCKTEFSSGAEGVRLVNSSLPLINKKTSGTILTEGPGIY